MGTDSKRRIAAQYDVAETSLRRHFTSHIGAPIETAQSTASTVHARKKYNKASFYAVAFVPIQSKQ